MHSPNISTEFCIYRNKVIEILTGADFNGLMVSAEDTRAHGFMHDPADVDGELLRFGTRQQQHAVVQGMQEALF